MAWDHTLARALPRGHGVVRFYRWARPTLSFGRNEPAREVFDPARLRDRGVDVVRRPTGGRSVLHDQELTYAVMAPATLLGGPRAAYREVNRGLAEGLTALGLPVTLATGTPALRPDAGPCFREPAAGEVVAAGRKLVGSAQVRFGPNLLQHGSILLEDGQGRIETLRSVAAAPPREDVGGIRGALKRRVSTDEVVEAVSEGLQNALPGDWRPVRGDASFEGTGLPSDPAPELLARYRSPEWSWRR